MTDDDIAHAIELMVQRLVDHFDPEQIILFGSHARGTAGPDSDVDLKNAALTVEEQEQLTDYALTTRYPGDYDPISLSEAEQAVETARRVREQVRQRLPEIVLLG